MISTDNEKVIEFSEAALRKKPLLKEFRAEVDGRTVRAHEVVHAYTEKIHLLMRFIGLAVKVSPSNVAVTELTPFFALVEAKESGGLERALGSAMLSQATQGKVDKETYINYITKLGGEAAYLAEFEKIATDQHLQLFEQVITGTDVEKVLEWRSILRDLYSTNEPQGLTPNIWFDTATKRLNLIKTVSDDLVSRAKTAAARDIEQLVNQIIAVSLILVTAIATAVAFALYQLRSLTKLLNGQGESLKQLATGNLDISLIGSERTDQIGQIAQSIVILKEKLHERHQLQLNSRRERDRERLRQSHLEGIIRKFSDVVAATVETVATSSSEMLNSANRLSKMASDASDNAKTAGDAAYDATANVQTVSSAAEQLSASVKEIDGQTSRAAEVISAAAERAEITNSEVNALSEAVGKIGVVTEFIQQIAEQTNMLALNATIEAARAGENGRGFAIVASEVKTLANQTATATHQISEHISAVQQSTSVTVQSVHDITDYVAEMRQLSEAIDAAVGQQDAATSEIAKSIELAAQGTDSAAGAVINVDQLIDETSIDAASVAKSAEQLTALTDQLSDEVEALIENVNDESNQRRNSERVDIDEDVRIWIEGADYAATLIDISTTGALLKATAKCDVGSHLKIRRTDGSAIDATVIRLSPSGIGVQFHKEQHMDLGSLDAA